MFFLFFTPYVALAQDNLVPNGSFEEIDTCPSYFSLCAGHIESAVPWFNPTSGSSDLLHQCAPTEESCGVPHYGVLPFEGVGMARITLYGES